MSVPAAAAPAVSSDLPAPGVSASAEPPEDGQLDSGFGSLADILGSARPSAPQPGAQCPQCGTQLPPGVTTCSTCGCDADLAGLDVGRPRSVPGGKQARRSPAAAAKTAPGERRKRKRRMTILIGTITGVVVVVLCVAWLAWAHKHPGGTGTLGDTTSILSFDWPELQRSDFAKLYLDGKQVPVRGEGAVHFRRNPGRHHVKLESLAKTVETDVLLKPEETVQVKVRFDHNGEPSLEAPDLPPEAPAKAGTSQEKPAAEGDKKKPQGQEKAPPPAKPADKPSKKK
jgi:predicted nucleic acid-binding Zn ribbon protein